jgi:formylglycine-generating enzyme required for sulfatase activity
MIPETMPAPPSPGLRRAEPALVRVPAGAFLMGEAPDDKFVTDTERPAHRVAISRDFELARFPVTVGEFRAFAPAHAPDEDPACPVVGVSWDDAKAYCAWLGVGTGRPPVPASGEGEPFRLPTEAEWEYACRAGSRTPFAPGSELTPAAANFLYSEEGQRIGPGIRTPAGRYPANAFGLHDLHGNVCEWVEDPWHPDYAGAPGDGSAWKDTGDPDRRVIRGGAWDYLPRLLRSAWRDSLPRAHRRDNLGFRVARSLSD